MRTLPARPYLTNIASQYLQEKGMAEPWQGVGLVYEEYIPWLRQFGFKVPVENGILEFPESVDDKELAMFILRWS